ncbi:MAG: gamma-glutamyl-gamma-aminobutyrate hydrolase family protein [Myxococcota bacterium]
MRPLIGMPPCLDARGRWKPGRAYHYLDAAYAAALSEAGAHCVVLPEQAEPEALVDRLDGLLLPGGDDLLPDTPYPDDVRFDAVPERQLAFDRSLLAAALGRDLPLLGICYGMQLLALHGGGRFHYDLPTDRPEAHEHRLPEADGRHALSVAAGSRLAAILEGGETAVNSLHHQAVSEPGEGAVAVAWAPDGVIEAIERPGAAFALGVQWHPEKLPAEHRRRVFGAFVDACRT